VRLPPRTNRHPESGTTCRSAKASGSHRPGAVAPARFSSRLCQIDGAPLWFSDAGPPDYSFPRSSQSDTFVLQGLSTAGAHTAEHAPAGQPWPGTPEKRPNLWANPVLTPPTRGNPLSGCYLPFPQSQLETGLPPTKPEPTLDITWCRLPCIPISRYRGLHGERVIMPSDKRGRGDCGRVPGLRWCCRSGEGVRRAVRATVAGCVFGQLHSSTDILFI